MIAVVANVSHMLAYLIWLCGVSCCLQLLRPLPPLRMAAQLAPNSCIPGAKATWAGRGGGLFLHLHVLAVTLCDT